MLGSGGEVCLREPRRLPSQLGRWRKGIPSGHWERKQFGVTGEHARGEAGEIA